MPGIDIQARLVELGSSVIHVRLAGDASVMSPAQSLAIAGLPGTTATVVARDRTATEHTLMARAYERDRGRNLATDDPRGWRCRGWNGPVAWLNMPANRAVDWFTAARVRHPSAIAISTVDDDAVKCRMAGQAPVLARFGTLRQ
ncbi:hypothetical protein AWV63_23870 [Micromonospora rifamycinica]|nr:hypothetical protein AWV63_23870 [Micromonospora rifamycinica]